MAITLTGSPFAVLFAALFISVSLAASAVSCNDVSHRESPATDLSLHYDDLSTYYSLSYALKESIPPQYSIRCVQRIRTVDAIDSNLWVVGLNNCLPHDAPSYPARIQVWDLANGRHANNLLQQLAYSPGCKSAITTIQDMGWITLGEDDLLYAVLSLNGGGFSTFTLFRFNEETRRLSPICEEGFFTEHFWVVTNDVMGVLVAGYRLPWVSTADVDYGAVEIASFTKDGQRRRYYLHLADLLERRELQKCISIRDRTNIVITSDLEPIVAYALTMRSDWINKLHEDMRRDWPARRNPDGSTYYYRVFEGSSSDGWTDTGR